MSPSQWVKQAVWKPHASIVFHYVQGGVLQSAKAKQPCSRQKTLQQHKAGSSMRQRREIPLSLVSYSNMVPEDIQAAPLQLQLVLGLDRWTSGGCNHLPATATAFRLCLGTTGESTLSLFTLLALQRKQKLSGILLPLEDPSERTAIKVGPC